MSRIAQFLLVVGLLVVAPLVLRGTYWHHVLILFCIFGILAYSLNISYGYAGQLSFGWSSYWGVGAYASALMALNWGWPFWVTMPLACVVACIAGFVSALVCFRAKGIYYSLIQTCVALVTYVIVLNWMSLTKGPFGLTGIPLPSLKLPFLPAITFVSGLSFYYLAMIGLLIVFFVSQQLEYSPLGRAIIALRENPALAQSIGVNLYKHDMVAFCMGAFFAGLAGAFYAHYFTTIDPSITVMHYTVITFLMVIVGGKGTLYGPMVGALFYAFLPEILRVTGTTRYIYFGLILIVFVIFLPGGTYPAVASSFKRLRRS